jgi:hypothetical protein
LTDETERVAHNLRPPSLRTRYAGWSAKRRQGGPPRLDAPIDPTGGALRACRRALTRGSPSYEFARFSFGEGAPLRLERLLPPVGLPQQAWTRGG